MLQHGNQVCPTHHGILHGYPDRTSSQGPSNQEMSRGQGRSRVHLIADEGEWPGVHTGLNLQQGRLKLHPSQGTIAQWPLECRLHRFHQPFPKDSPPWGSWDDESPIRTLGSIVLQHKVLGSNKSSSIVWHNDRWETSTSHKTSQGS